MWGAESPEHLKQVRVVRVIPQGKSCGTKKLIHHSFILAEFQMWLVVNQQYLRIPVYLHGLDSLNGKLVSRFPALSHADRIFMSVLN